ncbi:MAG TPA: hypothetical protein VEF35_04070 [Candidatus Bathyarchaeia archaeon]|nr:hypothetical protein [Candidatus Bathyarchaeia archaeon]
MKSHTLAGPTFLLGLAGSIFEIITGVLVVARGAVRGARIEEITSSLLSHIDDRGQKERCALRFFNHTSTIPAQTIR